MESVEVALEEGFLNLRGKARRTAFLEKESRKGNRQHSARTPFRLMQTVPPGAWDEPSDLARAEAASHSPPPTPFPQTLLHPLT